MQDKTLIFKLTSCMILGTQELLNKELFGIITSGSTLILPTETDRAHGTAILLLGINLQDALA